MSRGPGPKLFTKLSALQSREEELRADAGAGSTAPRRGNRRGERTRAGWPVVQREQSARAAPGKGAGGSPRPFLSLDLFHLLWSQSLAAVSCGGNDSKPLPKGTYAPQGRESSCSLSFFSEQMQNTAQVVEG